MLSEVGDKLLRNRDRSQTKSFLVGLERGRVWTLDYADYFEAREYSELDVNELENLKIPEDEERHFRVLSMESPLEWREYLEGWMAGVKEAARK